MVLIENFQERIAKGNSSGTIELVQVEGYLMFFNDPISVEIRKVKRDQNSKKRMNLPVRNESFAFQLYELSDFFFLSKEVKYYDVSYLLPKRSSRKVPSGFRR